MRPQTIHPAPRSTKIPARFAGWVGPILQDLIERIQALHPDLDIIGSFARVSEHDLAAVVLKAMTARIGETPRDASCREPFSFKARAQLTKMEGNKVMAI